MFQCFAWPQVSEALCSVSTNSLPLSPPGPPVPRGPEQPHGEVGGRVEGAGLSGSQRLLRRPRGERTLPQVSALGKEH